MFLYIDSLFAEGRVREVKPLHHIPDSLNQLYLLAMREHRRKGVLQHRDDDRWSYTPDWRLDRHVVRMALWLQEQIALSRGDRVALVSELRPEWLVADLATLALGGVSVSIPTAATREAVATALADSRPKAVFLSAEMLRELEPLLDLFDETELVVVFDAPAPAGEVPAPAGAAKPFAGALDLGGTLDTPERANALRERARQAGPSDAAIRHYELAPDGALFSTELNQGEIIARLKALWREHPAFEGDTVYVAVGDPSLDTRLALYSLIGDGYSTISLGPSGLEAEEIASLKPDKIIAPSDVLRTLVERRHAMASGAGAARGWLASFVARLKRRHDLLEKRAIVEALGGRTRWISPTTSLDPDLSALLSFALSTGTGGPAAHFAPGGRA